MATQYNIAEMNMKLKTAREINFPQARNLLQKNNFFSEPTEFGLTNQISLAIVAGFSQKEEYAMFQEKIDKLDPTRQVLLTRSVAIQKQANQMDNLNFLFPTKTFAYDIQTYRTLARAYSQAVENTGSTIDEESLRKMSPLLNTRSLAIRKQISAIKENFVAAYPLKNMLPKNTDTPVAPIPQYWEGSALDITELSKIVEELRLPPPPPAT